MLRRIALVTPFFGRDGGIAVHVRESAAALRFAGHDVTIICGRAEANEDSADVIVVPELDGAGSGMRPSSLARAVRGSEPDLVHVHDLADPRIVAVTRAVAPTVITAHAYPGCSHNHYYFRPGQECTRAHGPACLPNMAFRGCLHARNPMPVPGQYLRTAKRLDAYRSADAVAGFSQAVLRHLARNGILAQLVAPFTPTLRLAPSDPAREEEERHVVFVGRTVPAKGLDILLRAMRSVEGHLTVVGDGWERATSERSAADLGIAGRVSFAGWLAGDELHRVYRRASVVALPSLWPEPFGLVGIEAMAFGRPVVASMTGGVEEWLQPGVTGIAVAPGRVPDLAAALDRLLDDPRLRASMGTSARAAVEARFSEQAHVDSLVELYRVAAGRWSGRAGNATTTAHAAR